MKKPSSFRKIWILLIYYLRKFLLYRWLASDKNRYQETIIYQGIKSYKFIKI